MGLYQKYAAWDVDKVYQAYLEADSEINPSRVIELKNELEHRRAHGEAPAERPDLPEPKAAFFLPPKRPAAIPALPLVFTGTAGAYFRIWIVNLCLTLLTLGIFSAWAKVRKKRYFYSHTQLDGTPFQYLAQPIPILKGRLVAVAGFAAYYVASHFVTSLLPYVLAAGVVAAPWVVVRSAAFKARYSAYRNLTFHLGAGYGEALKMLYAWGVVPAFAAALIFKGFGKPVVVGIASFVFAVHFPWLICRIKKFMIENTAYGGRQGRFSASGGQFFRIYFLSGFIAFICSVPAIILVAVLAGDLRSSAYFSWLLAVPSYLGYVFGYAYVRAHSTNLVWNQTRLGPLKFQSTLAFNGLVGLYLTNALGIVVSGGLLIPWAVIRTLRYRVDHTRILLDGALTVFVGSEQQSVSAAGAEALDIFDWDLSL